MNFQKWEVFSGSPGIIEILLLLGGGAPPSSILIPMKGQGGQPLPTTPRPQPTKPVTRPPDEICHPNPCQNGGTCKATRNGGYKCICLVGYSGSHCQGEENNSL